MGKKSGPFFTNPPAGVFCAVIRSIVTGFCLKAAGIKGIFL
jgi:hypothetical protein